MEKVCRQFEDKLCTLLSFLTQLPVELEMIADEIDNENLKNALSAVAVESNQYAKELSAQMRTLEINTLSKSEADFQEHIIQLYTPDTGVTRGKEVLNICEKTEAFFTRLYNDVLGEYFTNALLKDMMNYQLMGIRSAFLRIKFLNSLRFSEKVPASLYYGVS